MDTDTAFCRYYNTVSPIKQIFGRFLRKLRQSSLTKYAKPSPQRGLGRKLAAPPPNAKSPQRGLGRKLALLQRKKPPAGRKLAPLQRKKPPAGVGGENSPHPNAKSPKAKSPQRGLGRKLAPPQRKKPPAGVGEKTRPAIMPRVLGLYQPPALRLPWHGCRFKVSPPTPAGGLVGLVM